MAESIWIKIEGFFILSFLYLEEEVQLKFGGLLQGKPVQSDEKNYEYLMSIDKNDVCCCCCIDSVFVFESNQTWLAC